MRARANWHTGDMTSRFGIPDLATIPADIRERIEEVAEKSGFIPNVFLVLAHRPEEARAFFAYHDTLMDKATPALSKADREMIVVVTSSANGCLYCVVAHGAILRIRSKNPHLADQVAVDWRKADLDDPASHLRNCDSVRTDPGRSRRSRMGGPGGTRANR